MASPPPGRIGSHQLPLKNIGRVNGDLCKCRYRTRIWTTDVIDHVDYIRTSMNSERNDYQKIRYFLSHERLLSKSSNQKKIIIPNFKSTASKSLAFVVAASSSVEGRGQILQAYFLD